MADLKRCESSLYDHFNFRILSLIISSHLRAPKQNLMSLTCKSMEIFHCKHPCKQKKIELQKKKPVKWSCCLIKKKNRIDLIILTSYTGLFLQQRAYFLVQMVQTSRRHRIPVQVNVICVTSLMKAADSSPCTC